MTGNDATSAPDIPSLAKRFEALAAHDPHLRVFGAADHGWEATPVEPPPWPLPADYRAWLQTVGSGAGPFYGLADPPEGDEPGPFPYDGPTEDGEPEEVPDGALRLSDHGCGYADLLVLNGPHAGEVWVDFRMGGGSLGPWYPTFTAWIAAWLDQATADWVGACAGGVPDDLDGAFAETAERVAARILDGGRPTDPMLVQYPLPLDRLAEGLANLHLAFGERAEAERRFTRAAALSQEPEARGALFRCALAWFDEDPAAVLAAADEGLATPGAWFATTKQLLEHRAMALEELERWDEAILAREAMADFDPSDVQTQLNVLWFRMLRGEKDVASDRAAKLLVEGIGCDAADPLDERFETLLDRGFLEALAANDLDADGFAAAVRERLTDA